ncbi:ABC transporter ATP-binding protein, partial [Anaerosporobacter sp.]
KHYTLLKNAKYALADMKIIGYRYYIYLLLDILIQIIIPFLLILIPAQVVRLLQDKIVLEKLLIHILVWIGGILILNLVRTFVHQQIDNMVFVLTEVQYWRKLKDKVLSCDFKKLESNEEQERLHEVRSSLVDGDGMGNYSGIRGFYLYGSSLIVNMVGFLLYACLAGRVHPLLLVILFLTSVINCFAKSKAIRYQFKHIPYFWDNNRRFWYLKRESINTEKAKDIRMYHMYDWFEDELETNTKEATAVYNHIQKRHCYSDVAVKVTSLIRDGFAYGFLVYQLMQGSMEVAEFLLYIGVVAGFGTWISQIVDSYTYLRKINDGIALFRAYINEEKVEREQEHREEQYIPDSCHTITFEDVSFGYDENMIFDHFSLTIKEGEKLALVGVNGAGKTTLMKLMCGLYPLNGGRILVDGQDIAKLDKEQYYRYISILFQDVHVLPFSIAKNVSCAWSKQEMKQMEQCGTDNLCSRAYTKLESETSETNIYEEERVVDALKQANLWNKVSSLQKGIHTSLTQVLDAEGIQLSGGETQRLMLARALYKNAPILILDEPTAALDPIAESELYEEYADLCKGKISVFISHRLSSTRFCDRILFLENGKIIEEGNHETLMNQNGKYADMYQIQAHYYQKEVERYEAGI